jgi:tetratricopeptide (TPR) repeat protein
MNNGLDSYLYVTVSANEGMVEDGTNELEALLKSKATENLKWDYRVIEGAEHTSTAYPGIYHGLRSYYHNYKRLQFNSLTEFKDKGGIAHVYEYYKGRAERFGFSEDLPPWTMFSLSRSAIRADSFTDFESLMNEFKGKGMINNIRLSRAMSLASYYSKNNKDNEALRIYEQLLTKNSDSALLQNTIGDVYVILKENKKAKSYYKKAIALAQAQKDAKLVEYQNDLKKIN